MMICGNNINTITLHLIPTGKQNFSTITHQPQQNNILNMVTTTNGTPNRVTTKIIPTTGSQPK